jgi:hypothetical protein
LSISLRRALTCASAAAIVSLGAGRAQAQANLSTQGFGFPTGQFSSRALGTGGAVAELDPLSPVNPASIALLPARMIYFQLEPEYRKVTLGNNTEATTIARYPNVFGALPIGSNWVLSVGASTLLDRTSTTSFTTHPTLSTGESVDMTTKYHIDGAMADVRVAAGWNASSWLRLGVGAHAITGHNLVSITQSFSDSTTFSPFTQSIVLGFTGAAGSAGVQVFGKSLAAAFSIREGGALHVAAVDTVIGSAHVPARFGASLAYTGIANSAIAIRTSHDNWSSLNGLGTPGLKGVDAWDTSIGGDIAGPRVGNHIVFLRAGFRTRTLPFQAAGNDVKENSITGGFGTTFATGRVLTDFALIHANRDAGLSATERAWTLSLGLTVRP